MHDINVIKPWDIFLRIFYQYGDGNGKLWFHLWPPNTLTLKKVSRAKTNHVLINNTIDLKSNFKSSDSQLVLINRIATRNSIHSILMALGIFKSTSLSRQSMIRISRRRSIYQFNISNRSHISYQIFRTYLI